MYRVAIWAFFLSYSLGGCAFSSSTPSREVPIGVSAKVTPSKQYNPDADEIASILEGVKRRRVDYRISPADLLQVSVYREEDLARTVRVSQQGTISFPLVGVLKVGGQTTIEAEQNLSVKLKDYLVQPQVSIFIEEYGNKQIFVLGEVKQPGSYDLPTETQLTVLEAISKAGGFSPVAAKDRTKVIRTGKNGGNLSYTIEVSAITTGGNKDLDIPLLPNDVIYVPQSFF